MGCEEYKPIALAGEIVTCPNGHVVCSIKNDLISGSSVDPKDFCNWESAPEPEQGAGIVSCGVCGKSYIRWYPGVSIHVGWEWRGSNSYGA